MQEQDSLRHELLAQVASVAPILAEHAAESEKLGHLDDVSWGALQNTRLLGFLCPSELGGDEADPLTEFEVIEALARVDASASSTTLSSARGQFPSPSFGMQCSGSRQARRCRAAVLGIVRPRCEQTSYSGRGIIKALTPCLLCSSSNASIPWSRS